MTTRQTISFPDDVAAAIADLPAGQVSAYVTEAVRRRLQSDSARQMLRGAGHGEFPVDPHASAARLVNVQVSDTQREEAVARLGAATGLDQGELAARIQRSADAAGW